MMDMLKVSQTLPSAFVLGILSQTAFVTLIVYTKGHLKSLLRDRRRLVLLIFLTFAVLWAQVSFIGFFLQSRIGCYAIVILSTASDQAARATISGLLLWTLATTANSRIERFALRGLIGLRVVQGIVFSGFTAPQFAPLCVARSRIPPLAIATIAFDATAICLLVCCIYQRGFLGDPKEAGLQDTQSEGLALASVTFGFFVWSSMSIPLQLGTSGVTLVSRIVVPSIGLLILLALVILASGSLLPNQGAHAAPLRTPTVARHHEGSQLVRSPVDNREVNQRGLLRFINPIDQRGAGSQAKNGTSAGGQISGTAPGQTRKEHRERNSGSIFRSIISAPLSGTEITITGESTLPAPPKQAPFLKSVSGSIRSSSKALKKSIVSRSDSLPTPRTKISEPIAISGPISGLKTVDLTAAAELQRQRQLQRQARRDTCLEADLMAAERRTQGPPSSALAEHSARGLLTLPVSRLNESASPGSTFAVSGSMRLKGSDEIRRRSPINPRASGHSEAKLGETVMAASVSSGLTVLTQHSAGFAPPVDSLAVPYENPAAAKSGFIATSSWSQTQTPQTPDAVWELLSPTGFVPPAMSIMDRKRPKVSKETDRTIFPRRESHLRETPWLLTPFTQQLEDSVPLKPYQPSSMPTAAAKLEPLIPDGVTISMGTSGIEHRFPAPPSSAPLPLPRFSQFSIPQILPIDSSLTKAADHRAAESGESPLPASISQMATPLQAAVEIPKGASGGESKSPHDMEKVDSEASRRSSTKELATEEDKEALSGSEGDFEMEVPIQLGYDIRSSRPLARSRKWHYRVGDTIPLFSERRRQKGSKAMPPPVPLLLHSVERYARVAIRTQAAEPVIKQTRKRDLRGQPETPESTDHESDDASVGSGETYSDLFRGRGSLLEKMERELNLKEQDWLRLQDSLNGNPPTSSTNYDVLSTSPRGATPNQKRLSNSIHKRISLNHRSLNLLIPTGTSENSRASTSQGHLAETQSDYFDRTTTPLNRGSVNFLTIDNYIIQTNPTPPESEHTMSDVDDETDSIPDNDDKALPETGGNPHPPAAALAANARLWRRSFRQQVVSTNLLWEAPPLTRRFVSEAAKPPALSLRTVKRRQEAPLRISSSHLWTKPEPRQTQRVDLWGQRFDRPKIEVAKRASHKPQKKSKRYTLLPDIGKDGVLGIFQTPWGPTDSARPPTLRVPSAAASQKWRPPTHNDSTAFDNFDDFNDGSTSSRIHDSTIWEIGTLLDDHNIPSRESLFPPKCIIIEDYDAEDDEDDDVDFDVYSEIYGAEAYSETKIGG
ncbi:hypothetical protein FGG08_004715 [Glutinoglossum americanum]|uniref:Uncharacterized protein n=1 Tax=Glutinoglossum americanum TaxID=1670608 RepID=A0A9P8HVW2_9PEZI|nr:hypothetical protein FGG08_004715 [Glutinoglossum americanum]